MIILGTNSIKDTGYNVANSCRFNSGSSDNLSISLSSTATNNKKGTLSFWFKTQGFNQQYPIAKSAGTIFYLYFNSSSQLVWQNASTNTRITSQVFRDPTAWGNLVVNFDTTQSTASNRQKMFYNGTEITSFGTSSDLSLNQVVSIFDGDSGARQISGYTGGGYWSGYMSEVVGIDGLQLDPTSFGEFDEDTGIWKPIDVSGLTFGNNGFYLDFESSGSLGSDVSGNSNNFTVNNLTAIDQTTDTCTNNFATFNPLTNGDIEYSDGNLQGVKASGDGTLKMWGSTFAVSSGKWYWEIKNRLNSTSNWYVGITDVENVARSLTSRFPGIDATGYGLRGSDGNKINNNTASSYGNSNTNGDIIMIALDLDNNKIWFGENGTFFNSGDPASGSNEAFTVTSGLFYMPTFAATGGGGEGWIANFGNPPYSISSGNSDGNGYGNFEYAVPSGYFALNTKNLAEYG